MHAARLLPLLLCLALCPPVTRADPTTTTTAPVLCLRTDSADLHGWVKQSYYTGQGVRAQSADGQPGYTESAINLPQPGAYRVHLLGASPAHAAAANYSVDVELRASDAPDAADGPVARVSLRLPVHPAVAWSNLDHTGRPGALLAVPRAGRYLLRVTAPQGAGCFLEKILLTPSNYAPTGMGPADTRGEMVAVQTGGLDLQVVLPPAWAFGVLYGGYTDQAQTLDAVHRLQAGDFPIDAYWIDSWFWNFTGQGAGPAGYLNFTEDKTAFPDVAAFWETLRQQHIKAGVWIWDCILHDGNEPTFDDFKARGFFADTYVNQDRWHNQTGKTLCGNVDFQNPAAAAYWQDRLAPLFAAGLDFLKIDRNSSVPFSRAAFEASQQLGRETRGRGFILAHLHSTYDSRTKLYPAKWTGDASVSWSQPDYPDNSIPAMGGFRENVAMVSDPGRSTYEVPFLAHDAGGYVLLKDSKVTDELYTRWLQFSALNTLTTLFASQPNPTRNHPTGYSERTQTIARHYLHLRMRLFPYLYTGALDTRLTGRKMIQGDGEHLDQYLFGPALLVAPVCTEGATSREVWLPAGRWFDWDTGQDYEGGRSIRVEAPLEKIPLFVRAGAIVPLRDYAASIEAGTNDHLTLEVYPGAVSTYTLHEDDGTSNDYLTGGFASTVLQLRQEDSATVLEIAPVQGCYQGMTATRRWTVRVHAQEVAKQAWLDGQALTGRYDAAAKVLTFEFAGEKSVRHALRLP